jgi:hypothetical protein
MADLLAESMFVLLMTSKCVSRELLLSLARLSAGTDNLWWLDADAPGISWQPGLLSNINDK